MSAVDRPRSRRSLRRAHPAVPPPGYDRLDPLIDRRIALGASQADVAQFMEISPITVSAYENGRVTAVSAAWCGRYGAALSRFEIGIDYEGRIVQLSAALDRALDEMPEDAPCRPYLRETLNRVGARALEEAA